MRKAIDDFEEDEKLGKVARDHIGKMDPKGRKVLRDELSKYPDPPGEEEYKGIVTGGDGEDLIK
jgi:hypothetical protein